MMYTHINVTQNWAFASTIAMILIVTSLTLIIVSLEDRKVDESRSLDQ